MAKNFGKSKVAVLAIGLVCALAFLLNHLATGANTSDLRNENNLSTSKLVKEIEGYKNWAKVNSVPQLMPERVAAACYMWMSTQRCDC